MTPSTSPEQMPPVLHLPTAPAAQQASTPVGHLFSVGVKEERCLLLTVAQAAQRLGIGRSLLYELLADGQVESIHIGRLRRIPADALDAFIDAQRQKCRTSP